MKNSGLKNEQKVQELLTKGSNALGDRNSAGVRLFKESDLGDGIISGKLIRPKYNNEELKKSIDTEIFELLPQEAPELPDMVLRSVYNVATQSINDLTLQVQDLTNEVSVLSSKVSELEIVSESLKIEADNQTLKANISENQALIANEQVASTTIDLQNAIQNSINEAIQRVSLTARNESLLQENITLREQLFGQTAQIAAGAKPLTETVALNSLQKDAIKGDIYGFAKKKNNGGFAGFQSGQKWEVVNSGNTPVSVTFEKSPSNSDGQDTKWFRVEPNNFTVQAGQSKEFQLKPNTTYIDDDVRPTGTGKAREYDGTLTVKLSTGESVILNTKLKKVKN